VEALISSPTLWHPVVLSCPDWMLAHNFREAPL
jgi:hypothetical protein